MHGIESTPIRRQFDANSNRVEQSNNNKSVAFKIRNWWLPIGWASSQVPSDLVLHTIQICALKCIVYVIWLVLRIWISYD